MGLKSSEEGGRPTECGTDLRMIMGQTDEIDLGQIMQIDSWICLTGTGHLAYFQETSSRIK